MGSKETPIQSLILEFLKLKRILAWRNQAVPVPVRRGGEIVGLRSANKDTIGIPDILGCINGRLFAIEVKSEKGALSVEQKRWRDDILREGGAWVCARSLEEVQVFLKEMFNV